MPSVYSASETPFLGCELCSLPTSCSHASKRRRQFSRLHDRLHVTMDDIAGTPTGRPLANGIGAGGANVVFFCVAPSQLETAFGRMDGVHGHLQTIMFHHGH